MTRTRRVFLWSLAGLSAGLALWVLVTAARAGQLSGQVFMGIAPLAILFSVAVGGLSKDKDT